MTTIILPAYNEAKSIVKLLPELASIEEVDEIILVDDDSPDGTAYAATKLSLSKVRAMIRKGQRGLASAIRYGAWFALTDDILVMDSDGQHSPSDARKLIEAWSSKNVDLVIGSRFAKGAEILNFPWWRLLISKIWNLFLTPPLATKTSDPMTGFFLTRKELVLNTKIKGFKILYDILSHNRLTAADIPITFGSRIEGDSKTSLGMGLNEILEVVKITPWLRH